MSLASTPHDNLTFVGGTIFSTKYLVGYFFCQVVSARILFRIALQDFFQNRIPPPHQKLNGRLLTRFHTCIQDMIKYHRPNA